MLHSPEQRRRSFIAYSYGRYASHAAAAVRTRSFREAAKRHEDRARDCRQQRGLDEHGHVAVEHSHRWSQTHFFPARAFRASRKSCARRGLILRKCAHGASFANENVITLILGYLPSARV